MTIGAGANVDLTYVTEVTRGTTPGSPTMKLLRTTSRNINLKKNLLNSQELRSDQQLSDLRHGFKQIQGSIGFEYSLDAMNDMIESVMGSTFATAPTTGAFTPTAVAASSTYTRAGGSYITDGFKVNDWVLVSGFITAANNGYKRVTAVVALTITVDSTLVNEVGSGDEIILGKGKVINMSTGLKTFTFERRFTDLTQYQLFLGCAVNQMAFQIKPEQIVGGTMDIIGMSGGAFSGSSLGSPTAAPTNSPFDAFNGDIYIGGTSIATITSADIQITRGRNVQAVVGTNTSPDVFPGQARVSGTVMAFFESVTMYNYFANETEAAIHLKLDDLNGTDFVTFTMPRNKFNTGDIDPPQEGPVSVQLGFMSLVDTTTTANGGIASTLRIQKSSTV